MDVLLQPWLKIARLRTDYLDNTGATRGLYTGSPETTGFGGDRLKMSLEFIPTSSRQSAVERATIRAFLASLRGRQNRAILHDPSYRKRGSFPATELLTNNTFANGTTGLTNDGQIQQSVADRVLRGTRISNAGGSASISMPTATVTQYAPHVGRAFFVPGRGTFNAFGPDVDAGSNPPLDSTYGLKTHVFVPNGTTATLRLKENTPTGQMAGDYFEVPYTSLSRGLLVDNGINAATHSNALSNAAWTKNALTPSDNILAGPDGVVDADGLVPTTSNVEHYITRTYNKSATAQDVVMYGVFQDAGYDFVQMAFAGGGSGAASCTFNVATGAIAVVAGASGDWSNARAIVRDMGAGWYLLELVARTALASYTTTYYVGSGSGTFTFAGDGTSGVRGVLLGTGLSSSFVRPIATTTTAVASGTSQTGNALHVKGGRTPSEGALAGALLKDDRFAVLTSRGWEMKIVTAPLDLDAAGLGYLQFSPPLMGIPADNAPIVIHEPMTRAIFAGEMVGWEDSPGVLTTASCEFEEAA